jgi:hypothetical protein
MLTHRRCMSLWWFEEVENVAVADVAVRYQLNTVRESRSPVRSAGAGSGPLAFSGPCTTAPVRRDVYRTVRSCTFAAIEEDAGTAQMSS